MSLCYKVVAEEDEHINLALCNHCAYLLVSSKRTGEQSLYLSFIRLKEMLSILYNQLFYKSSGSSCCIDIILREEFPVIFNPTHKFLLSSVVCHNGNVNLFHFVLFYISFISSPLLQKLCSKIEFKTKIKFNVVVLFLCFCFNDVA